MIKAAWYEVLEDGKVRCTLCPRHCIMAEGGHGYCRVRHNQEGILFTENDALSALALDPVEKKPLFHFYPGKKILSIGASGCNFRCEFCQNWQISQSMNRNLIHKTPEEIAREAERLKEIGNIGVAYTYSEPTVMFEYMEQTAKLVRQSGMKNVMVSNGYMEKEPLRALLPYLDACNIDLKAFTGENYQKHFQADMEILFSNLEILWKSGIHLEISCLIVPGVNDNPEDAGEAFRRLGILSRSIPVHINRYYPCYKMTAPPTDLSVLSAIADAASKHLEHIYMGNI